ncbi:MAG: ferrous iron transporter B [Puniceicoccales bacterium]|jgi:ferrous iron transport protein B|nr:ferrous iron transporter B [Puniceicoccales bacterium]
MSASGCFQHPLAQEAPRIALMGQPNTGKSTIFNLLTRSRQHTANWSGKTTEPQAGICCSHSGKTYTIVDLPGTQSLSPHSGGEKIACEYLWDENLQGIILVLDGSQLSRSMYLLTDFAGLSVPVVVVVTMVDVLKDQGREIDFQKLEIILGVPVIPIAATCHHAREKIIGGLERLVRERPLLQCKEFITACRKIAGEDRWKQIQRDLENFRSSHCDGCDNWLALKLLEGNGYVREKFLPRIGANPAAGEDGNVLRMAGFRHRWIRDRLLEICAQPPKHRLLNRFDRVALHPIWGTILAFLLLFLGFALSALAAGGFQHFLRWIANLWAKSAYVLEIPALPAEILNGAVFPGLMISAYLLIFVGMLTLTIGVMEDVGYIGRIAYLFNGLMSRIGLPGKCIIPFVSGFSCTVAGVCGARVIDCPCQRRLTIAACWVVPCSGTWGTVGFVSVLFFGPRAIWAILGLFLLMVLHIILTVHVFRDNHRSSPPEMLMDLPPYHRPNWKNILSTVFRQMGQLLLKSIPVILLAAFLLWLFLRQFHPSQMDAFTNPLAKFAAIFGLHWKLFVALALALINRESALGGIAILFGGTDYGLSSTGDVLARNLHWTTIEASLIGSVSTPGALAFLCAFFLSPPCCAAIAATAHEVRSYAWTLRLLAYYFLSALLVAAIVFRLASPFS